MKGASLDIVSLALTTILTGFVLLSPAEVRAQSAETATSAQPAATDQAVPGEDTAGSSWSLAADAQSPTFIPQTTPVSASGMLTRVGLGLVLVLGILGGVLFLYKKASRGTLGGGSRTGIELVTQRSLGQRSSLAVVRVGDETMLLGITANQINMLSLLGPKPAAEEPPSVTEVSASLAAPQPAPVVGARALEASPFDTTLAGEVRRVRENLVTSLRRLDPDPR